MVLCPLQHLRDVLINPTIGELVGVGKGCCNVTNTVGDEKIVVQ